jgi:hypothetical protein
MVNRNNALSNSARSAPARAKTGNVMIAKSYRPKRLGDNIKIMMLVASYRARSGIYFGVIVAVSAQPENSSRGLDWQLVRVTIWHRRRHVRDGDLAD